MSKILVTAKITPDIDATSCILAYAHLLKTRGEDAEGIVFGSVQPETQYFGEKHGIAIPTEPDNGTNRWDKYVLVDASSMKGMPSVVQADRVIEIIDHRESKPETEFLNAKIQNELIGAAATLVVERFRDAEEQLLPEHAKLLYGAIHQNSLNFLASNTSQRDRDAARFLEQEFGLSKQMSAEMFSYATRWMLDNIEQALKNDAKEYEVRGIPIRAYQMVVYGSGLREKRGEIEQAIAKLSHEVAVQWSFLNIVDLETNAGSLYCDATDGQARLARALGCEFKDGWAVLKTTPLRKQIMPKLATG